MSVPLPQPFVPSPESIGPMDVRTRPRSPYATWIGTLVAALIGCAGAPHQPPLLRPELTSAAFQSAPEPAALPTPPTRAPLPCAGQRLHSESRFDAVQPIALFEARCTDRARVYRYLGPDWNVEGTVPVELWDRAWQRIWEGLSRTTSTGTCSDHTWRQRVHASVSTSPPTTETRCDDPVLNGAFHELVDALMRREQAGEEEAWRPYQSDYGPSPEAPAPRPTNAP